MATEIPFLAIDFGTSFSKTAWFNPKSTQAEIIHTGDGEERMPLVVFYGEDTEWGKLVGKAADEVLEDCGHDPEIAGRFVDSVKRALLDPPVIALPGGRSVTPVTVVADILGRLKHDAETRLFHQPVARAVITHPAVFDPQQQQVIRRGAETAKFGRQPGPRSKPSNRTGTRVIALICSRQISLDQAQQGTAADGIASASCIAPGPRIWDLAAPPGSPGVLFLVAYSVMASYRAGKLVGSTPRR